MKRTMSVVVVIALMLVSIPMQGFAEEIIAENFAETEAILEKTGNSAVTGDVAEEFIDEKATELTELEDIGIESIDMGENQTEFSEEEPAQTMAELPENTFQQAFAEETETDDVGANSGEYADDVEIISMEEMDIMPVVVSGAGETGEENGFAYKVLEDETAEITGYDGTEAGDLVIPSVVDNYKVTSIGSRAFRGCNGFTGGLVLPNSLTSIGDSAFSGCSGLRGKLALPNSLTSIGDSAFGGCGGFTGELILPDSLTSIGNGAFASCNGFTGDLVLPGNLTSIEDSAFNGCSGFIGNLVLPNSLTSIGNYAFYECSGFTGELVLPDSLTNIGVFAFAGCRGFTGNLILPDNLKSIKGDAFANCSGCTGKLVLPNGLTSIEGYAFLGCSGFTGNLILPDNLTSIGEHAFDGCSGFTGNLVLPDGLTSIKQWAFAGCRGFTGNLIIPQNVTSIGSSAFEWCSGIICIESRASGRVGLPTSSHWYQKESQTLIPNDARYLQKGTAIKVGDFYINAKEKTNMELTEGDEVQLTAIIENLQAEPITFSWATDNDAIVKVDTNGKIKAIGVGYTTITATAFDTLQAKLRIVVKAGPTPSTDPMPGTNPTSGTSVTPSQKPGTATPVAGIKVGKASIKSLKNNKKNKAVLKIKKVNGASGYEIVYGTSKKLKKNTKTITTKKLSVILKNLKKNKTYYVKVRAYKQAGRTKVYGKYSKVKKVKIKK